jgi:hypothetical protein
LWARPPSISICRLLPWWLVPMAVELFWLSIASFCSSFMLLFSIYYWLREFLEPLDSGTGTRSKYSIAISVWTSWSSFSISSFSSTSSTSSTTATGVGCPSIIWSSSSSIFFLLSSMIS